MDFSFTAEQQDLRRTLRDLVADRVSSADLRRAMDGPTGCDDALWAEVGGALGLAGIGVTEDYGGAGGDFVDVAVVAEECGRSLMPVPLVSTLVAASAVQRSGTAAAADLLPSVASGKQVASLAAADGVTADGSRLAGVAANVLDGHLADVFVVAAGDGLWALRRGEPGVVVRPQATLDPTRRQATLRLDGAPAARLGGGGDASTALDLLRVALAVEAVGVARRCLEMTVDYLKTRVQFGRPIGSFQALQHRAADLAVEVEAATSTAYYAAWAAADSPDELPVVAPLAKAVCADAAWHVAAETVQLHGGIGFTWEHDAHLYVKRATTTRLLLGDAHDQRRLVARRAGIAAAATFSGRERAGR